MGLRGTREKACVAENDMVQFVQYQHEKVFIRAAMLCNKVGIQSQAWPGGAVNTSRWNRVVGDDVQQREEFLHLPCGGRNDAKNAGADLV